MGLSKLTIFMMQITLFLALALLQNPGRLGSAARGNSKVGLGVGLGILGVLLALIIVGIIGFSVSKMIENNRKMKLRNL